MRLRGALCHLELSLWVVAIAASLASGNYHYAPTNHKNFVFTQDIYSGTIHENALGKTYIISPVKMGIHLVDPSLDVQFRIVSGDKKKIFRAEDDCIRDFCFLRVRTKTGIYGELNREMRARYRLKIKAHGKYINGPEFETLTELNLRILDRNDLSPLFIPDQYSVKVAENTPLHKSIVQVTATDADEGVNGEVYYSFVNPTYNYMFAIHPTSGVVSLTRPLKYSDVKSYELEIGAKDRGPRENGASMLARSRATLKILVEPVNYHSPEIKVQNLPAVVEHGNQGTLYAILTVTDKDTGRNGEISSVLISEGNVKNIFRIVKGRDGGVFNIIVTSGLDRERTPFGYNLTITATDSGTIQRTTSTTVRVKIQDTNDNEPRFEKEKYVANVSEVVPKLTPVLFVRARDQDFGKNAEVTYKIVDGDKRNLFTINKESGLISTSDHLDSESVSHVELTVHAEDQANSGARKIGKTSVVINIEDYNDNAPVFDQSTLTGSVKEHLPPNTPVMTVTATDADSGENGKVSYSIANIQSVPFKIDDFTGTVKTTQLLDYEVMRRNYKVRVRASDWGTPFRQETETVVTIKLEDVNDRSPEFQKVNCTGYISREALKGTKLVVIPAIDFDNGNIISYEIADGNHDDCFKIEPSTGTLSLGYCDLRAYSGDSRTITVVATDGIHTSRPTTVSVTLVNSKRSEHLKEDDAKIICKETDVTSRLEHLEKTAQENNRDTSDDQTSNMPLVMSNIYAPVFSSSVPAYVEVSEGTQVGTTVLDIIATDRDNNAWYNNKILYVVSQGNDDSKFKVDSFTGALKVLLPLDREIESEYLLTVTAMDMGHPSQNATKRIRVVVIDENDNAPKFEYEFYTKSMYENVHVNSTVVQVFAKDADSGLNARVTYSILTDTDDFEIVPSSGMITVKRPLDRERQEVYELEVQAKDSGLKKQLFSKTRVTINLEDVNDNIPSFVPESYNVKVREDLPVGTVVMTVTAVDPDAGVNGKIIYKLIDGTDDKFEIDEMTGTIRITQPLDYETKQVYNITARAEDGGKQQLISACLVNVEVVDVNENLYPPEFDSFITRGSVSENVRIGTFVMHVSARDPDGPADKSGQIIYSIRDGSGLGRFTIDNNGTIRTNQVLDRETASHYWLTVYAQDRGLVPRFARLEVLIDIVDVNDNVPLSKQPAYHAEVPENSKPGVHVVKIQATDGDKNPEQRLHYEITGGNPQHFFTIDPNLGVIMTTNRTLNREKQKEHALQVTISDNGYPKLSSTTRVVIKVLDINDEKPRFLDKSPRIKVLEKAHDGMDIPVYRVVAQDKDEGMNANVTYSIKSQHGNGHSQFRVDQTTGIIYSTKSLVQGKVHDLQVKAMDNGNPPKKSSVRLHIEVVERPTQSANPPRFTESSYWVSVTENDRIGHLVVMLSAEDDDGQDIWFSIKGGNEANKFMMQPKHGSLLLSSHVDWETQPSYNMTVCATDGVQSTCTWVYVKVIDINDNEPQFSEQMYKTEVSENVHPGTSILQVTATDRDEDKRLIYTLSSAGNTVSRQKFRVNSQTGVITVAESLDREALSEHILTMMVRDQGTPSKRSFARVLISVLDHNDHQPQFLSSVFEGRVYETAAVGTSVVQVIATDNDKGDNAEISFSIVSGNIGETFAMDQKLGILSVAKELDRSIQPQFDLVVMATDGGSPPLRSSTQVKIFVTVSNNSPPKFRSHEYTAELDENLPPGTIVIPVYAVSQSSVVYDITAGNDDGLFTVNPNSGVISTKNPVDYERHHLFNMTVSATNIVGAVATTHVVIHVFDMNDNRPEFWKQVYVGNISEAATVNSMVLDVKGSPLVVQATDQDSGTNCLLKYEIVDMEARKFFHIDSSTGAIKTSSSLDHETKNKYNFTVQVADLGKPHLRAAIPATVIIYVTDLNDSPPRFTNHTYRARVLLPTYRDVAVVHLHAVDPDSSATDVLTYSIVGGNEGNKFAINPQTGILFVQRETAMTSRYELKVQVSDGKFDTTTAVVITVEQTVDSGLRFTRDMYIASVHENSPKIEQLTVVQTVGHRLNEHLQFSLLNNKDMFVIGKTSGVLKTRGLRFDREQRDNYTIVVEVLDSRGRLAHVVVRVTILDVNDNAPMFVNQPYYSVVSFDARHGELVKKVTAVDKDQGNNGQIRYSIIEGGEGKFNINHIAGQITVEHLTFEDQHRKMNLIVEAQDKGRPPRRTRATVPIHVINRDSPVFDKQFYNVSVLENIAMHSPVTSIQAVSPKNKKLIYSISDGDLYGDFAVDFNTAMDVLGPCLISVIGELDYEETQKYELTLRATDTDTGSYTETKVSINLEDVNDNAPVFTSQTYTKVVSESKPPGSFVMKVRATDSDSGVNSLVHYSIAPSVMGSQDVDTFHIDSKTGVMMTKKQLDHEKQANFFFLVVAIDSGMPALNSTSLVHVMVLDLNDNAPIFSQPSYDCSITDQALRGQLVTKVIASDEDLSDSENLVYSIVDGNERQALHINSTTGLISVSEQRKPDLQLAYTLNVSVTDGVYTSYARVTISVRNTNHYTPTFSKNSYYIEASENMGEGLSLAMLDATDEDRGTYGMLTYTIPSEEMMEIFQVDADTGELFTKTILDREEQNLYVVPVAATDNGGRMGFTTVHINIRDTNDNVPRFLMQEYKGNVYHNAKAGQSVLQVEAVDYDAGANGKVVYSVYDTNNHNIAELFEVNKDTGMITLKGELTASVNKVFQFFIQARDQGRPPLEDHVSVDILVMGEEAIPPVFHKKEHSFFISEDEQVGAIIATIKANEEFPPVQYSIVPGFTKCSNDPSKFDINQKGQITVLAKLDREETSQYTLNVKAETKTTPPLVAYTKVNVQLRDVNDNDPKFESNPYTALIVENSKPGTEVIQVQAQDKDLPVTFSYHFGNNMEKLANIFSLDSHSGWLTLMTSLDREDRDEFNITVIVYDSSDRFSGLRHSASTSVIVTVTDHNDNPPVFSNTHYKSAVNEDALAGTVLITVTTTDADIGPNADVSYYITSGDPLGQFQVHSTGEVFVNKRLDREMRSQYHMTIAATDGGFVTYASMVVSILDDNDHAPKCEESMYTAIKPEDIPINSPIAHIKATDADERGTKNAKIEYHVSGEGSNMFRMDKASGVLRTIQRLDRETQAEYKLIGHAVDGGGRSCTAEVLVFLKDVNDNAPEFTLTAGTFSIHENARLNTLLTRVTAVDKDTGINRRIRYRLTGQSTNVFTINPKSGIISLISPLDREIQSQYDITVIAFNVGSQTVSSETTLKVVVLDINDNPPEFEHTSYYASIREDAVIDHSVVTVIATSLDIGINARITYSIAAGNEQGKFKMDPQTGIVRVSEPLDHELSREYFLTVLAKDEGVPPLSNTAIININITDVNDNPPRFGQSSYTTSVKENAEDGTEVIKVLATDVDSFPNARITYSIQSGDHDGQFLIGLHDGIILVNGELDREKVETYALVIHATDSGRPSLWETAVVNIEVLDTNDNSPEFSESNYTVFVQRSKLMKEGRRIGVHVLQFLVTDADLEENGPPFSFDIIKGNDDEDFYVSNDGILTTAGRVNKKVKATYHLTVRVFDSGQPIQYSDAVVTVNIIDESMHAPEVRNLSISISSYMDRFAGGVIGKVEARDSDPYDQLMFNVVSNHNRHLFEVSREDGRVIAHTGLDAGEYIVNVSVSDGKFTTFGQVVVHVISISEDMVNSAITIQFKNMIPEQFFASSKKDFQKVLKRELNVRARDVEIINVQPAEESGNTNGRMKRDAANNLDVLFTVRKSPERFFNRNSLRRKVERAIPVIEKNLNVRVVKVFSDTCTKSKCSQGTCVGGVDFDDNNLVPVVVGGESFVSARHHYTFHCACLDGSCPDVMCGATICPAFKVCEQYAISRYRCVCPNGKSGKHCDEEIERCRPSDINCRKGERPMTFAGKSYAKWTLALQTDKRLSLSLWIKTRKLTANLMYTKGRVDYSILEINNGMLQYRFDCGSGQGLVRIPIDISDGNWHRVVVERNGREAELFLDLQYKAMTMAPGINDVLNLDTYDIYFGAEVDILPNNYRDISGGFEGCMKDIRIFDVPLLFSGSNKVTLSQEFEMVDFHCKEDPSNIAGDNICSSFPCMHGGKCLHTGLNAYICQCLSRYQGAKCEIDTNPCEDKPCQNEGRCQKDSEIPNGFKCQCIGKLQGKRCEYGDRCIPNPCEHGGTCIEGPNAPLCYCLPGYKGSLCEIAADVCQVNPCLNGGTCISHGGKVFCNCTSDRKGMHCEEVILPSITSDPSGINSEEIYGIAGVGAGLILVVLIFVGCRIWRRRKRERAHHNITPGIANGGGSEIVFHGMKDGEMKRCKISNPDLSALHHTFNPQPPPVPTRPASYTPSTHDSLNTLNNFDTVRNYGSAADELETTGIHNIPTFEEYLQTSSFQPPVRNAASIPSTLPPPPVSSHASDTDSIQKAPWEFDYPNILEHYPEVDKKHSTKCIPMMNPPVAHSGLLRQDASSFSSLPVSESEEDLNGYHWDTSDWAPRPSLPNISEVPAREVPDSPSSSSHSQESNTHINNHDEPGEITDEPDYVDESEYVGDSEFAENEYEDEHDDLPPCYADHPNYQQILALQDLDDTYELPRSLQTNPSHYLPNYSFTGFTDRSSWPEPPTDEENGNVSDNQNDEDNDSVVHYGSQKQQQRRQPSYLTPGYTMGSEYNADRSMIDDMSVSAGGYTSTNASCSDISAYLCEIEDSEINASDDSGDEDQSQRLLASHFHTQV